MNLCQPFEGVPGRRLADRDVGIIGYKSFTVSGIYHAHRKPHGDQGKKHGEFRFFQRKGFVISRSHSAGSLEWIFLSKNHVCGSDGKLRDSKAVMHVTEVDHASNLSRLRPGSADEYVVIVGVPVDDAAPQAGQSGNNLGFVKRKKSFDKLAPRGVADVVQVLPDPTRARQIPFQLALYRRMRKILQRGVHFTEQT